MDKSFLLNVVISLLSGGTIVAIIQAIRYRKIDAAKSDKIEADSIKTLAESYGLRAEAEIRIAAGWEKLASDLQRTLIVERQQCANEMADMQLRHDQQIKSIEGQMMLQEDEIRDLKKQVANLLKK